jgi:hypothetical protein
MAKAKLKRTALLVLASLFLLYCLGYVVSRRNKTIVHYTASVAGKCTYHEVASGDYKLALTAPAVAFIYTPLRYVEAAIWKLAKPQDSPC